MIIPDPKHPIGTIGYNILERKHGLLEVIGFYIQGEIMRGRADDVSFVYHCATVDTAHPYILREDYFHAAVSLDVDIENAREKLAESLGRSDADLHKAINVSVSDRVLSELINLRSEYEALKSASRPGGI